MTTQNFNMNFTCVIIKTLKIKDPTEWSIVLRSLPRGSAKWKQKHPQPPAPKSGWKGGGGRGGVGDCRRYATLSAGKPHF